MHFLIGNKNAPHSFLVSVLNMYVHMALEGGLIRDRHIKWITLVVSNTSNTGHLNIEILTLGFRPKNATLKERITLSKPSFTAGVSNRQAWTGLIKGLV